MPWSNQNGGGGPWGGGGGGGDKGPWGSGPNRPGGNGNPPELDEFIRRGQDKLKNVLPGGMGGNGGIIVVVILLLAALWLFKAVYTVQPQEQGVVLLFGKPEKVAGPGLHFHYWPVERVELVSLAQQQIDIGSKNSASSDSGLMLSGDQNIVNVQFSVLYTVNDSKDYLFNVEDPSDTLRQVSESAMREVVGSRPVQNVYRDNREAVAEDVKNIIQKTLDSYKAGIEINTVSIEDASPPREVADAFDEVQRAEQDEDRFVEEANRYANQKLGRARGEASQIREEAAAYKDRVVKEAEGEASRFDAIYKEYAKAPEVIRQRMYLETMEGVMKDTKKVIMDEKQGSSVPYISLNELLKSGNADKTAKGATK